MKRLSVIDVVVYWFWIVKKKKLLEENLLLKVIRFWFYICMSICIYLFGYVSDINEIISRFYFL